MLKDFNRLYTDKLPSCPLSTQASLSDRIISLCFIGMAWLFWMLRTLDSSIILISHQSHLNSAGVADVLRSPAIPTVRSFNATNSLNILPCLTYSTGTLRANFAITLPKKPFVEARCNALMDKICLHVLTRYCGLLPWHVSAHTCKVPLAVITTDPCQLKPLWICHRFFPHPCLTPWQLHIVKQEWCGQEKKRRAAFCLLWVTHQRHNCVCQRILCTNYDPSLKTWRQILHENNMRYLRNESKFKTDGYRDQ